MDFIEINNEDEGGEEEVNYETPKQLKKKQKRKADATDQISFHLLRESQNRYRQIMIENKLQLTSQLINSRNSYLNQTSPVREYSSYAKDGVLCLSCSGKKQLRLAMLKAFKHNQSSMNFVDIKTRNTSKLSKITYNGKQYQYRQRNLERESTLYKSSKKNQNNLESSEGKGSVIPSRLSDYNDMGSQYNQTPIAYNSIQHQTTIHNSQPIMQLQSTHQLSNSHSKQSVLNKSVDVSAIKTLDIAAKSIKILPEIESKFKVDLSEYDFVIRDIRNTGKYNGKKLKASQAESMMVRKKNHEFFQDLNTLSLSMIKQKFEPSKALQKFYKNTKLND